VILYSARSQSLSLTLDTMSILFLPRVLLALLLFTAAFWTAYVLARRLARTDSPSLQLTSTLIVFLSLQHVAFELLTTFHAFRPPIAAAFWAVLALVVHRTCRGDSARQDFPRAMSNALVASRTLLRSPVRAVLFAWAVIASMTRLAAGLVVPPLSWDSLTYHIFKPARWVHYGYQFQQLAPDQWRYKEFFPQAGEYPWGWAMLASGNDSLLPVAGFLMWAACGLAAYALSRRLGGQRAPSFYAGLITAFIPAIQVEMVSGYVDMFVLLAFLLAGIALVQLEKEQSLSWAALAGLSLGLIGSSKLSGPTVAGLGFLGVTFIVLLGRPQHPRLGRIPALAVALAGLLLLMAPTTLRTWAQTGSPVYPLTVRFGKHVVIPGNSELFELYARKLTPPERAASSLSVFLKALFIPFSRPKHEYMGLGPGVIPLLPLAAMTLYGRVRRRRLLTSTTACLVMVWVPALALLSDDFAAQRATWYIVMGRLIASLPAFLAILAAQFGRRITHVLLAAASIVGLLFALPRGLARPVVKAMMELLPAATLALAVALATGLVVLAAGRARARVGWAVLASLAVFLGVIAIPWTSVRTKYRYPIYEATTSEDTAFVMHLLWDFHSSAWPIWQYLDDGRAHRIDACYGWDGIGHNGFRYPLAGSNLQNEVLYVPISRSGEVIDYREGERVRSEMDRQAWLDRLQRERIDYVVTGFPSPPEQELIESSPQHFERVASSRDGLHFAYRFKPTSSF
jgi:hypothetical protein